MKNDRKSTWMDCHEQPLKCNVYTDYYMVTWQYSQHNIHKIVNHMKDHVYWPFLANWLWKMMQIIWTVYVRVQLLSYTWIIITLQFIIFMTRPHHVVLDSSHMGMDVQFLHCVIEQKIVILQIHISLWGGTRVVWVCIYTHLIIQVCTFWTRAMPGVHA